MLWQLLRRRACRHRRACVASSGADSNWSAHADRQRRAGQSTDRDAIQRRWRRSRSVFPAAATRQARSLAQLTERRIVRRVAPRFSFSLFKVNAMKSFILGAIALAATTTFAVYSPAFTDQSSDSSSDAACRCDCECCLISGCCLPGGSCECDFGCCGPDCSGVSGADGADSSAACCQESSDANAVDGQSACCESGCCQTDGS